jgi:hypothetical protein
MIAGDLKPIRETLPAPCRRPAVVRPSCGRSHRAALGVTNGAMAEQGRTRQGPPSPLAASARCDHPGARMGIHNSGPARTRVTGSLIALGPHINHSGKQRHEEVRLLVSKYLLIVCQCGLACPTLFRYANRCDRSVISPPVTCSRCARRRDSPGAARVGVGTSIQDNTGSADLTYPSPAPPGSLPVRKG